MPLLFSDPSPLPRGAPDVSGTAPTPATAALPRTEEAPINILIVDDEPRNLTALETVLEEPGYRLVRAESAEQALLALVAEEFALLILDIQMPGMNGFELAHMIKQRKKTAGIPIIFLTAFFSEDEHVMEGYGSGAVDYLHKPINAQVLRSKVAVFAELHRRTEESLRANHLLVAEVAERRKTQELLGRLNAELEQRVAERTAALSASEGRFRALAEEMPHLVWETDAAGVATYQNARWQNFTGQTVDGAAAGWIAAVHPDDAERIAGIWRQALEAGEECDCFCRYLRAHDGVYRWFHVKAAPMRDAAGAIIRWVGTSTDIHEQRQAEEALREADKRKDEFLAMLGHELRNPLAAIRHAVQIELEAPNDPEAHLWTTDVIERQSLQLTRMVDDLLDIARIRSGRIELRLEQVDLKSIFRRATEVVEPLIQQRRHTLTLREGPDELTVRGDAARLEQIFVNLLNNAAKYTPEGGQIALEAGSKGTEATVSIIDNGVGIAPDLLPYVFDLFKQADTSLDRAEGGLGIGLTVVKSLVEMHGGRIAVTSGDGVPGTTVRIDLPLSGQEMTKGPGPAKSASDRMERTLRVLVVDDHEDAAEALSRLLRRRNCDVRIAHNGKAGLIEARAFQPEVLLLDLGLPDLDGYELARTLRREPQFDRSLFIAISGYAQESDRERSLDAGFHHHCAKPVDFPTLLSVIRSGLG